MTASRFGGATGHALHDLFREVFALHRKLAERMDIVHEAAGLGTPQVKVLDVLDRRGAATVPDVAADQGVSRQFVLTVCHELETLGLIVFSDNPRHRRSRLAALTVEGRNAVARFREAEAKVLETALPGLDADAVAAASLLLREIGGRIVGAPQEIPGVRRPHED